jgi:transcription antitermination factor NusG
MQVKSHEVYNNGITFQPEDGVDSVAVAPWYAVKVKSRFEITAAAVLHNRGLQSFVPTYTVRRQWSDRNKRLDLLLFPGYLFCKFEWSMRLLVLSSPGVVHIVCAGNRPVPVAESEMNNLIRMSSSGLSLLIRPQSLAGRRVRIVRGPLEGVEGVVVTEDDEYHVAAPICALQCAVYAKLDRDWVMPELTLSPGLAAG